MLRKEEYKNLEQYKITKREQTKRHRRKNGVGQYGYGHWTEEQLWLVLKHEHPDSELSKQIHKSITAISHARRRLRLGIIQLTGYNPVEDTQYGKSASKSL